MPIQLKRAYDEPAESDGYRVLADRLWPRGVSKEDAQIDAWIKDAAPSEGLRKWFHENQDQWDEFRRRYLSELKQQREELRPFAQIAADSAVTLVFSSKDKERNNAAVLKQYLEMLGG